MTTISRAIASVLVLLLAFPASGCVPLMVGAAAGAGAGTAAAAKEPEKTSNVTKAATVAVNILYVPSKLLLAGGGAAAGAVVYLITVGDTRSARRVWRPTLGGTYVVTPRMVEGREKAHFFGS